MTRDPAPHLLGPDDAYERLSDWRRKCEQLMRERDPLVKAALARPLAEHGGVRQGERASGLTAQTLRRIKSREDIPLLDDGGAFDDADWDEYADYLKALGTLIKEKLAALPAPAAGRAFTADDLRASLLVSLAQRLRDTELTDFAHWQLTMELRTEAEDRAAVLQEEWTEPTDGTVMRAARAQVLTEVADQITAYRIEGSAAAARLNQTALARVRSEES